MDVDIVPDALVDRLGTEATGGLLHVRDRARREWTGDVLSVAAERFERRLTQDTSGLRVQVSETGAALREEMGQLEIRMRQDLTQTEVRIIREIGASRFELLKWSFVFWIGQVVAMSAIMAAMVRAIR